MPWCGCARTSAATGSTSPSAATPTSPPSSPSATTRRPTTCAPAGASVAARRRRRWPCAPTTCARATRTATSVFAPGIDAFLHHEALLDAARRLYDRPVIEPAIAYANILLPGQELAVHTDVPEFRGANRKLFPQWLMVVMHHSGLFERWRMPIATGIAYFSPRVGRLPEGGELAYWPDGADGRRRGPAHPPQHGHRARHRLGVPRRRPRRPDGRRARSRCGPATCSSYDGDVAGCSGPRPGQRRARSTTFGWDEIRFSVSWKAYCFADEDERDAWRTHADDLDLDVILGRARHRPAGPRRAHRRRAVRARPGAPADRHLRAVPATDPTPPLTRVWPTVRWRPGRRPGWSRCGRSAARRSWPGPTSRPCRRRACARPSRPARRRTRRGRWRSSRPARHPRSPA